MDMRRRLFRLWLAVTAIWLVGCIWFGAAKYHWFESVRIHEVADSNDEKYRIEIDPASTDDEVLEFVQKSAGSKWLRRQCARDMRGPWCDVVTSLKMPRQYFTWPYLVVSIGGTLSLLMAGSALFWTSPGFRRSPNG